MRPLAHPAIDDITVEGILHALADPVRAQLYLTVAKADCTMTCTSAASADETPIPKSTLSQHFKVLRESGLIRSERRGVELHNSSRCQEIEARFPGLLPAILAAHERQRKACAARA